MEQEKTMRYEPITHVRTSSAKVDLMACGASITSAVRLPSRPSDALAPEVSGDQRLQNRGAMAHVAPGD